MSLLFYIHESFASSWLLRLVAKVEAHNRAGCLEPKPGTWADLNDEALGIKLLPNDSTDLNLNTRSGEQYQRNISVNFQ